jgi:hypothetical protein
VWLLAGLVALSLSRVVRWVYVLPLLPAAACLAACALEGPRARALLLQRRGRPGPAFAAATGGVLAVLVGWHACHSSAARSQRGAGTAAFVRRVEAERSPGDRLLLHEGKLGNALHFLLDRNEPALGRAGLQALLERPPPAGRTLLVTSADASLAQVQSDHPGRFAVRLEESRGERLPGLVLLELAR